jgi:hypothetical protein
VEECPEPVAVDDLQEGPGFALVERTDVGIGLVFLREPDAVPSRLGWVPGELALTYGRVEGVVEDRVSEANRPGAEAIRLHGVVQLGLESRPA